MLFQNFQKFLEDAFRVFFESRVTSRECELSLAHPDGVAVNF